MENIQTLIQERRSVRTFDGRDVTAEDIEKLSAFMAKIENPFEIPVTFTLLDAKKQGLSCPVVSGTDLFVGTKVRCVPYANEAVGYALEMLVLYAQSQGLGTVWVGGTMNRAGFERAMALADDEMMPCVSPLGYPGKMSIKETLMRKAVKADSRLPFETLFFDGALDVPLTKDAAGRWGTPLDMVRLAPSAVNKQPWRVIVQDNAVHFYLKRSKGFGGGAVVDMQRVDLGIALCHFALTAKESGLDIRFAVDDPAIHVDADMTYIASYKLLS